MQLKIFILYGDMERGSCSDMGGGFYTHPYLLKNNAFELYFLLNYTTFQDLQIKKKVTLNLSSFQRYREDSFREKLKQPT